MTETILAKAKKISEVKKIIKSLEKEDGFNIEGNEENGFTITANDFSISITPKMKSDITIEFEIIAKVKHENKNLDKVLRKYRIKKAKEYSLLEIAELIVKYKDSKDLEKTIEDETGLSSEIVKKYFTEIKSQGKSKYANKTIKEAAKVIKQD